MSKKSKYIPKALGKRLAVQDRRRCAYCLTGEKIIGIPMEIDHIIPKSLGGPTEFDNLCLACTLCNNHKNNRTVAYDPQSGEIVLLFNPRTQDWNEHFAWTEDGTQIIGLTATGRATVEALAFNRSLRVEARQWWVEAGWHPPKD